MSATLETPQLAKISRALRRSDVRAGGSIRSRSNISTKPVRDENYPIWDLAADELERLARSTEGDVLIFMPGKYEIRRTISAIRASRVSDRFVALPLHGELPPAEQDAALAHYAKAQGDRRDERGGNFAHDRRRAGRHRQRPGAHRAVRSAPRDQHAAHRKNQPRFRRSTRRPRRPDGAGPLSAALDGARTSRTRGAGIAGSETARSRRSRADFESERRGRDRQLSAGSNRPIRERSRARNNCSPISARSRVGDGTITRSAGGCSRSRSTRVTRACCWPRRNMRCVRAIALIAALTQGRNLLRRAEGKQAREDRDDLFGGDEESDLFILMRAFRFAEKNNFDPRRCARLVDQRRRRARGRAAMGAISRHRARRRSRCGNRRSSSRRDRSVACSRVFPIRSRCGWMRERCVARWCTDAAACSRAKASVHRRTLARRLGGSRNRKQRERAPGPAHARDEDRRGLAARIFPEAFREETWRLTSIRRLRRVIAVDARQLFHDLVLRSEPADVSGNEAAAILAREVIAGTVRSRLGQRGRAMDRARELCRRNGFPRWNCRRSAKRRSSCCSSKSARARRATRRSRSDRSGRS